jgi:diguanylate cyclase
MSIIQVDCRGLKHANERHGHHLGDQLLQRTAALIQAATRDNDLVARVGGDEFAILLYDTDEPTSQTIVDRIRIAIETQPALESITIGVAIGVATTSTDDLLETHQTADARMLASKRGSQHALTG